MNISVLLLYLITDHRVDRRVVPMLLPMTWAKIPPWRSATDPGTVSADGNPVRSRTPTASNSPQWRVFYCRREGVLGRRGAAYNSPFDATPISLSFTVTGAARRDVIPPCRI